MSDAEWNAWQSSWKGASGPLPEIRKLAVRQARLHVLANVGFFALVVIALLASIPAFELPDREARAIGWTIIAFVAVMSIGYVAIQRGIGLRRTGTPREALAFLERRLAVERRAAQLVRWGYVALLVACVIIFPPLLSKQHAPWWEITIIVSWLTFVFAVTFSAPWWVDRLNRRLIDDVARWRGWLDEQQL